MYRSQCKAKKNDFQKLHILFHEKKPTLPDVVMEISWVTFDVSVRNRNSRCASPVFFSLVVIKCQQKLFGIDIST